VTGAARLRRYAGTTGDTRSDTKKSTMLSGFRSAIFNLIHWTLAGNCRCAREEGSVTIQRMGRLAKKACVATLREQRPAAWRAAARLWAGQRQRTAAGVGAHRDELSEGDVGDEIAHDSAKGDAQDCHRKGNQILSRRQRLGEDAAGQHVHARTASGHAKGLQDNVHHGHPQQQLPRMLVAVAHKDALIELEIARRPWSPDELAALLHRQQRRQHVHNSKQEPERENNCSTGREARWFCPRSVPLAGRCHVLDTIHMEALPRLVSFLVVKDQHDLGAVLGHGRGVRLCAEQCLQFDGLSLPRHSVSEHAARSNRPGLGQPHAPRKRAPDSSVCTLTAPGPCSSWGKHRTPLPSSTSTAALFAFRLCADDQPAAMLRSMLNFGPYTLELRSKRSKFKVHCCRFLRPLKGPVTERDDMSAARQSLARVVAGMRGTGARSMAGGGSTGGKTPTYKRMRGVVIPRRPPPLFPAPPPPHAEPQSGDGEAVRSEWPGDREHARTNWHRWVPCPTALGGQSPSGSGSTAIRGEACGWGPGGKGR